MSEQSAACALDPEFEALLRECLEGLISPDAPLEEHSDLAALGIDSLIVVRLLVTIEDVFGVAIPDELITFEIFSTPGVLWNIVAGLMGVPGGH